MRTIVRAAVVTMVAIASHPALSQEIGYFRTVRAAAVLDGQYRLSGVLPAGEIVVAYPAEGGLMRVDGLRQVPGNNGWMAPELLERVLPELGPNGIPVAGVCFRDEPDFLFTWERSGEAVFRLEDDPEVRLAMQPAPAGQAVLFDAADGTRFALDYHAGELCSASSMDGVIRPGGMLIVTPRNGEEVFHGVCCSAGAAAF